MIKRKDINQNTNLETVFAKAMLNAIHIRLIDVQMDTHHKESLQIKNHRRSFNVLYAVHKGTETYTNLNHTIKLRPGSLVFFPINSSYEVNIQGPLSYSVLRFYTDTALGLDLFHSFRDGFELNKLYKNFNEQFNKSILNPEKHIFSLKSLTYKCCQHVIEKTGYNIERQHKMYDKYQAVFKGYADNPHLKVEEISTRMNISPTNLTTQFKKDMGMPVSEYRNQLLIKKAATLLSGTNLLIRECAIRLGFTDELYFSRFFKKQIGLSPKKFREITLVKKQ
ncbi:MAG: AraC family transcriptional regulator [Spirochaetaceae bacterium]